MPDLKTDRHAKPVPRTDRLPPFDSEAEMSVLGCILIDQQCITQCVEAMKDGAEEFYDLRHQTIYSTCVELFEEGERIDLITIQARLKLWDKLEQVGGLAYLASLPDKVPSAANLESYLEIVREMHMRRKMIRVATEVIGKMYDPQGEDISRVLDTCERDMLKAGEVRVQSSVTPIKKLVTDCINDLERQVANKGEILGLRTGFPDFDKMTGGLLGSQMIVVAARPRLGKTSLCLNIADHVAIENKIPVGVFSLEMKNKALVNRLIASRARVNLREFQNGNAKEADLTRVAMTVGQIAKAPIYIDDTGGLSILQLRAKARRMWQQYGIKLFIIDYLQLVNALGGKRRFENRQAEVSAVSTGIKELAKELDVPIIVLAQLNRDTERDKNTRPRLSSLRESGQIEADADIVTFLYRPASEDEDDEFDAVIPVTWMVEKNRDGAMGPLTLTFFRQYTRFESAAKVSPEDYPQ